MDEPAAARGMSNNSPKPQNSTTSPSLPHGRNHNFNPQYSSGKGYGGYTQRPRYERSAPRFPSPKFQHLSQSPAPRSRQHLDQARYVVRNLDTQLKVRVQNLPPCDTAFIFEKLQDRGTIVKIEIPDKDANQGDSRIAYVYFKPVPRETTWLQHSIPIVFGDISRNLHFEAQTWEPYTDYSPLDKRRKFMNQITVAAEHIGFGVMKNEISMLQFHTIDATLGSPCRMVVDLRRKCIDIEFSTPSFSANLKQQHETQRAFKMRINLPQIQSLIKMQDKSTGAIALVLTITMPPLLLRKTTDVAGTHEPGESHWNEWQMWYRQTGIQRDQTASRMDMIQLKKRDAIIDIGRWLTYKLVFSADTVATKEFSELCDALCHHDIAIKDDKVVAIEPSDSAHLWNWLDNSTKVSEETARSSALAELHQMAEHTIQLPFEVRYQLEACVSNGVLHEFNINNEFLKKLEDLDTLSGLETKSFTEPSSDIKPTPLPKRATKLLEKAAEEKERIFDPMDIFPRFLHKASITRKRVPVYCASIRSAIMTPTTIYFVQATVETSNSVIRKYRHYEDRFLRVKFTDELYKGKIMSNEDSTMNEVFTRIKRAMMNGIYVGGRHYEFLAFGNSQFREGGAYFFASTSGCSAQDIRGAMGEHIKERTVAKYCARLGQAFATTRATPLTVDDKEIPDVERNGYCFTDGVGKISPFLAQYIAQEHKLPSSITAYPSVFQFRHGGSKGVLAVDPSLTGKVIQIRPSQRKFGTANQNLGLDICRISQLSAANLNMQLILVLSTLGVHDDVFLNKMDEMLKDLSAAMTDEHKALELLQRNIDFNQMTIQLAQIVFDGFMETKDPFMITCLRLWRAWSIKYLKEKARIYVEQGAFIFGCVDETAVLKGHFDNSEDVSRGDKDESSLPEIFLRIEQPPGSGQWTVIVGVCILARNPSLHPGDVRVVVAVDKPALYHYRNCVVLPQTGDRDIANMCSGGDLDGDDYLVIWDKDLLPGDWNYPAMDFKGATPAESDRPVTVNDITSFFVTYMKYDNLSRIAVAHRYWADASPDGVKDPKCLELAALHSTAVDYVKTGVPAKMGRHLRVKRWPHWAEKKGKAGRAVYHSNKVLGQLYDMVKRVDMNPAWDFEFDSRILDAYELHDAILDLARKAKQEYDAAILRIMAKYSIKTEFEVWTTFVMEHSDDYGDYKFAETIGEEAQMLKDHQQQQCFEMAGTDKKNLQYQEKIGPFVAAMYTVTKQELDAALEECKKVEAGEEDCRYHCERKQQPLCP